MSAGRNLLRFGIGLVVALAVVTGLFTVMARYYNAAIVWTSNTALGFLEHPRRTILRAEGSEGAVLRRSPAGDTRLAEYTIELYFEVVLFLALMAATPAVPILRRLLSALAGFAGFIVFHTISLTTFARAVVAFRSSCASTLLLFVGVALAVLLWALSTFRYWVPWPRKRRSAPPTAVGRNDPCPCGSGKKYKHCCGRRGR